MKVRFLLISMLLVGRALAEAPSGYAYGWPLILPGEGPAWQVELGPEVHAASVDPRLGDVEVFDAHGRPVPAGPLDPDPSFLPAVWGVVPVFELRRGVDDDAASVRLRIDRPGPGSVRVDAAWEEGKGDAPPVDYLLDLRRVETAVSAIEIEGQGAFRYRFAVEASDDLETWRAVVPSASVLRVLQDAEVLEKLRVEIPATRSSYLRLRTFSGEIPRGFVARVRTTSDPSSLRAPVRWVQARLVRESVEDVQGRRVGVHVYEIDGFMPVERLRLEPAAERSLAEVRVLAERGDDSPVEVTRFSAIDVAGLVVARDEVKFGPVAARTWRLESSPPLSGPPKLMLGYRPLRLVFLAQGRGPYLLVAGSRHHRRTDAPIAALLLEAARSQGFPWEPPAALLGERVVLEGEGARRKPVPWQRYVLWGVLVAGAGLVVLLGVGMLRKNSRDT